MLLRGFCAFVPDRYHSEIVEISLGMTMATEALS